MSENLYGDLLKIAGGDIALVEERVSQFRDFANTVSGSSEPVAAPAPASSGQQAAPIPVQPAQAAGDAE